MVLIISLLNYICYIMYLWQSIKLSGWLHPANICIDIKTEVVAGIWELCVYKINKHSTWINSSISFPHKPPPSTIY